LGHPRALYVGIGKRICSHVQEQTRSEMGLHVDFVAYTRCSHALATAECIELILKLFTSVPVWLHVIILSMHGNDDREREMTVVLCCVRGS